MYQPNRINMSVYNFNEFHSNLYNFCQNRNVLYHSVYLPFTIINHRIRVVKIPASCSGDRRLKSRPTGQLPWQISRGFPQQISKRIFKKSQPLSKRLCTCNSQFSILFGIHKTSPFQTRQLNKLITNLTISLPKARAVWHLTTLSLS